MIVVSVGDDWYGPGTQAMRRLATRASRIKWFSLLPDDGARARAEEFVRYHVELLRSIDAESQLPAAPNIAIRRAPWHALDAGRWSLDFYEGWARRWKDPAGLSEVRCLQKLWAAVESSADARQLLRLPLWPIHGHSNVLGGAFVTDTERDRQLRRLLGGTDYRIAWALLCNADTRIWDALLWELARGAKAVHCANPMLPIIELYELGYLPLGWSGGCYELYVPELTPTEESIFAEPLPTRGENYISWRD